MRGCRPLRGGCVHMQANTQETHMQAKTNAFGMLLHAGNRPTYGPHPHRRDTVSLLQARVRQAAAQEARLIDWRPRW